jgi:uncharacterized protein (UPF0264 family)
VYLLTRVTTVEEIAAAMQKGADIIDVKNPAEGALGAGLHPVIRRMRQATPRNSIGCRAGV